MPCFQTTRPPCSQNGGPRPCGDMTHCFRLNKDGCHAKQRLPFRKQAERGPPGRECAHFLVWQMREEPPAKRRRVAEGSWREGRGMNEGQKTQGAAGKEAWARNLTPGKVCTPTLAPSRPRLILARRKRQALWSSTVERG